MDVYNAPKLERENFIENGVLLGFIKEHEKRCSYSLLESYVKKIKDIGDPALEKILKILKFDHEIRPFLAQKLDLNPSHMNLYLGRPLTETISMFGLHVIEENNGTFLLTIKS